MPTRPRHPESRRSDDEEYAEVGENELTEPTHPAGPREAIEVEDGGREDELTKPSIHMPEAREVEPVIRRSVEFRDASGGLIGTVEYELEDREVDMPYVTAVGGGPGKGRRLRSLMLTGEKDGKQVTVDVLDLANPHGTEVIVADEYLVNYSYTNGEKRALSPPLNTPLDMGVLLHELGHADQFHEERFKALTPLYASERRKEDADIDAARVERVIDGVVNAIPNVEKFVDREALGQLHRLGERKAGIAELRSELSEDTNRLDERDAAAAGRMIAAAMNERLDVERFLERCVEVEEDIQDHTDDAAYAAERVRELRQTLRAAGFRFGPSAEGTKAKATAPDGRFLELHEQPLLAEDLVDTVAKISDLVQRVTRGDPLIGARIEYSPDGRKLLASLFPPGNREYDNFRLQLELDMYPQEFRRISREHGEVQEEFEKLRKRDHELEEQRKNLNESQDRLLRFSGLSEIVAVPTKVMERDATRRAIQWMRMLRDRTGADLLKPHTVRPESMIAVERDSDCVEDATRGMAAGEVNDPVTTVYADLKRALGSYGADKSWKLQRPEQPEDDEGPDTMRPVPR